MANPSTKVFAGPVAMASSAANIYTCAQNLGGPTGAAGITYDIIKHIHVTNTTATPQTWNLYLSSVTATETAGKELFVAIPIGANGVFDYYTNLKATNGQFLVGHASAATVSITVEGESYVV